MKNESEIEMVMEKLHCSREEIETLSDESFDGVVRIVSKPQPPLTEKEKEMGQKIAERIASENNDKINAIIETISSAVHAGWMEGKRKDGFSSRKSETGEELMVDFDQLSEGAKELDRRTVRTVIHELVKRDLLKLD